MGKFKLPERLASYIKNEDELKTTFFETLTATGSLQEALKKVFKAIEKETQLNIAVIGQAGAGKSSLINALAGLDGDKAALEGVETDTTTQPQEYTWENAMLIDFPGFGTERFKEEDFIDTFDFACYDLILNVVNTKVTNTMKKAHDAIISKKFDYLVVRTYLDGLSGLKPVIDKKKEQIISDIKDKLGYKKEVCFVCTDRYNARYKEGVDKIQQYIKTTVLKKAKEERFKKIVRLIQEEYLKNADEKAKEISDREWWRAVKSVLLEVGVTGISFFNPIPGVPFAISCATEYIVKKYIQGNEDKEVREAYGIEDQEGEQEFNASELIAPTIKGVVRDKNLISQGVKLVSQEVPGVVSKALGPIGYGAAVVYDVIALSERNTQSVKLQEEVRRKAQDVIDRTLSQNPDVCINFE